MIMLCRNSWGYSVESYDPAIVTNSGEEDYFYPRQEWYDSLRKGGRGEIPT